MKIFGIGLFKTGTTSLAEALRLLGYRTAHAGPQVYSSDQNRRSGRRLFFGIDHLFDAYTDSPCMFDYPRLDSDYPGSKFIWTHRDPVSWAYSMEGLCRANTAAGAYKNFFSNIDWGTWARLYRRHMEEVPAYFAGRSDFLSFPICDGRAGWRELCRFLDVPLPDTPFPRKNVSAIAYRHAKPLKRLTYRLDAACHGEEKDSPNTSTKKGC